MPEYFEISLIIKKNHAPIEDTFNCLKYFDLSEGTNKSSYFNDKLVIVSSLKDSKTEFNEVCISIPEQTFHRENFDQELEFFTHFITKCFECNNKIQYALCSYEINSYLLENAKRIEDFSSKFLKNFPIVYKRKKELTKPLLLINLDAQGIFKK